MRDNPTLVGTEKKKQIKKCPKAPHVFMELRESAAQEHPEPQMKPGISIRPGELWERKADGFWQERCEAFQRIKRRVHGLRLWTELLSGSAVLLFTSPERARKGLIFISQQCRSKVLPAFGI